MLEKQAEELAERIRAVEQEMDELRKIYETLAYLAESSQRSMISSIGKGVSLAVNRTEEELFV